MTSTAPALARFLRIASAPPSPERWSELFTAVGEWPEDAASGDEWATIADSALQSWPDPLRAAVMSEDELVEPDTFSWGVAPDVPHAPWLRLVRTLSTPASDVLAAPAGGGWAEHGFPAVRRFCVRDRLSLKEVAGAVRRLPSLQALDLSSAVVFPSNLDAFRTDLRELWEALSQLPLDELSLARLPLSAAIVDELGATALARRLKSLNASSSRTPLGDAGAEAFARWPATGCLEILRLAADGISDRGAKALWRSGLLDNLRVLDLSDNALSSEFVSNLLEMDRPSLVELDLHGNQLTDPSVEQLAQMSLTALRRLSVAHNRFTSAGARRLSAWAATRPGLACVVKPLR